MSGQDGKWHWSVETYLVIAFLPLGVHFFDCNHDVDIVDGKGKKQIPNATSVDLEVL